MSLNGFVIWGEKGQTLGWVEPFSATVRVTEGGDCLVGYHITCGDAATGLRTLPYRTHVKTKKGSAPKELLFVFSNEPV
jgi:hypothetical protein